MQLQDTEGDAAEDAMTAFELLGELAGRGFTLTNREGALVVTPASKLKGDDRDALKRHKAALLAVLALDGRFPPRFFWMYRRGKKLIHHMGEGENIPQQGVTLYTWEGAPAWFRT